MKKGRGSFIKPIFFEFYDDPVAFYKTVMDTQFMVGKALMVTPIVER